MLSLSCCSTKSLVIRRSADQTTALQLLRRALVLHKQARRLRLLHALVSLGADHQTLQALHHTSSSCTLFYLSCTTRTPFLFLHSSRTTLPRVSEIEQFTL